MSTIPVQNAEREEQILHVHHQMQIFVSIDIYLPKWNTCG